MILLLYVRISQLECQITCKTSLDDKTIESTLYTDLNARIWTNWFDMFDVICLIERHPRQLLWSINGHVTGTDERTHAHMHTLLTPAPIFPGPRHRYAAAFACVTYIHKHKWFSLLPRFTSSCENIPNNAHSHIEWTKWESTLETNVEGKNCTYVCTYVHTLKDNTNKKSKRRAKLFKNPFFVILKKN